MRAMVHNDLTAVLALEQQLYPVDAWSGAQFLEELRGVPETRYYVVIEEDSKIIGYAGVMVVTEHADIATLSVAKEYQGKGLGQRLLNELEREAQHRGATSIFLEVQVDNQAAIGLYKKNGYRELGRRDDYYAPGVDALVMNKELGTERAFS